MFDGDIEDAGGYTDDSFDSEVASEPPTPVKGGAPVHVHRDGGSVSKEKEEVKSRSASPSPPASNGPQSEAPKSEEEFGDDFEEEFEDDFEAEESEAEEEEVGRDSSSHAPGLGGENKAAQVAPPPSFLEKAEAPANAVTTVRSLVITYLSDLSRDVSAAVAARSPSTANDASGTKDDQAAARAVAAAFLAAVYRHVSSLVEDAVAEAVGVESAVARRHGPSQVAVDIGGDATDALPSGAPFTPVVPENTTLTSLGIVNKSIDGPPCVGEMPGSSHVQAENFLVTGPTVVTVEDPCAFGADGSAFPAGADAFSALLPASAEVAPVVVGCGSSSSAPTNCLAAAAVLSAQSSVREPIPGTSTGNPVQETCVAGSTPASADILLAAASIAPAKPVGRPKALARPSPFTAGSQPQDNLETFAIPATIGSAQPSASSPPLPTRVPAPVAQSMLEAASSDPATVMGRPGTRRCPDAPWETPTGSGSTSPAPTRPSGACEGDTAADATDAATWFSGQWEGAAPSPEPRSLALALALGPPGTLGAWAATDGQGPSALDQSSLDAAWDAILANSSAMAAAVTAATSAGCRVPALSKDVPAPEASRPQSRLRVSLGGPTDVASTCRRTEVVPPTTPRRSALSGRGLAAAQPGLVDEPPPQPVLTSRLVRLFDPLVRLGRRRPPPGASWRPSSTSPDAGRAVSRYGQCKAAAGVHRSVQGKSQGCWPSPSEASGADCEASQMSSTSPSALPDGLSWRAMAMLPWWAEASSKLESSLAGNPPLGHKAPSAMMQLDSVEGWHTSKAPFPSMAPSKQPLPALHHGRRRSRDGVGLDAAASADCGSRTARYAHASSVYGNFDFSYINSLGFAGGRY